MNAAGAGESPPDIFETRIVARRRLSTAAFELELARPEGFAFIAGQRVRLHFAGVERDYSIVSPPAEAGLKLCVRRVAGGRVSPALLRAPAGSPLRFSGPHGYFTFKPSPHRAVFIATGVGIAPFCAMAADGVSGFTLLHGVESPEALLYQELLRPRAECYVACVSGASTAGAGHFTGRVTDFIKRRLAAGTYDFYACGRQEMVRDATMVIDERFAGSRVYSEVFY